MIGNQRLDHFSESRGKSFRSDTLGGNAGTLVYQEDFIGEALGIRQPGLTAQANEPFAGRDLMLADDPPRRMVHVGQFDRCVGECTTALGLVLAGIDHVVLFRALFPLPKIERS